MSARQPTNAKHRHRVVVVGGGFGGLLAAKLLSPRAQGRYARAIVCRRARAGPHGVHRLPVADGKRLVGMLGFGEAARRAR